MSTNYWPILNQYACCSYVELCSELVKVQRDYQVLSQLISTWYKFKASILYKCCHILAASIWQQEAHAAINALDLKQECVDIGPCKKKRMAKNCDMENTIGSRQEHVSPAVYAALQCCQPTCVAVERLFWQATLKGQTIVT